MTTFNALHKRAVPVHRTSAVDTPWDGSGNVGRLRTGESADYYFRVFAYQDAALDETTKGAYKLPHHEVSENGVPGAANVNGCIAAIAALNGARGGVDIPDTQRRAVWRHLATHIEDADRQAPELKEGLKMDNTPTTVEAVCYSALFQEREKKGGDFYIRGFASVNSEDRDGDFINPALFSLDTYLKNPQLWFNHEPWRDESGNAKSIGRVEEAVPVEVQFSPGDTTMTLLYCTGDNAGSVYRNDVSVEDFAVKNGMRGLWVVCNVTEPAIQTRIVDRELNAFSWQGLLHRSKSGAVVSIDLLEVSVVILPANQRATFQIGKMLHLVGVKGNITIIDLDAVKSLIGPLRGGPLTDDETALLERRELAAAQSAPEAKGGESMDPEIKEALDALNASVAAGFETVAARVATVEAGLAEKATVPVTPAPPVAVADVAPAVSGADEKMAGMLTTIAEKLETLSALPDVLSKVEERLNKLEAKTPESRAASDADEATEDVSATLQKAFASLDAQTRAQVARTALANTLVPDFVVSR